MTSIAARAFRILPLELRRAVRRYRLRMLVKSGRFDSEEPEYRRLAEWLGPGDIALDVGANFGSYTLRMSELVGNDGRVFAFEPVPQTFAMLIAALTARNCRNVTALNIACSDASGPAKMWIDDHPVTGENLYQATITQTADGSTAIYKMRADDLPLPRPVKLIKIDAEGHDAAVIAGMWQLICASMPTVITEHPPAETIARFEKLGYSVLALPRSPNKVFIPPGRQQA